MEYLKEERENYFLSQKEVKYAYSQIYCKALMARALAVYKLLCTSTPVVHLQEELLKQTQHKIIIKACFL